MLMRYVEVWKGLSKYFVFVAAESDMVFDSPSPAEIMTVYDSPPVNVTWFSASLSSMLKLSLHFVLNCASEVARKVDGQVVLAR